MQEEKKIITPNTNLIAAIKDKVSQSSLSEFLSMCHELAFLETKIKGFLNNYKKDEETNKIISLLKVQISLLEEDKAFIKKEYDPLLEEKLQELQELKKQVADSEYNYEEKEEVMNKIVEIEKEFYSDLNKEIQSSENKAEAQEFSFGNELKRNRVGLSLTQKELGAKIGVAHHIISLLETGRMKPTKKINLKLQQCFAKLSK